MTDFQVNKNYLKANVSHSIRFTEPLYERLSRVAKEKNVSFNSLVLQCCEFSLEHMGTADKV